MVVKHRTLKNANGRGQTRQKVLNCSRWYADQDEWFEQCTWTKKELMEEVQHELDELAKAARLAEQQAESAAGGGGGGEGSDL
jgi:hypothetical protein|tara:strand:- start:79 stop:327 length:249 start_codon:yes stop_codon:yes gene_type:complete